MIMSSSAAPPSAHRIRLIGQQIPDRVREAALGYACLLPWMIGFVVLHAGALLYSFGLAFFHSDMLTGSVWIGMRNYEMLVGDKLFLRSLRVTVTYAVFSIPLRVSLALVIALMLNQEIPGRGLWRTLYYLPSVVSGIAVAILWGWMFNPRFGLVNLMLGLIGIQGPRWLASEEWALPALILMSLWGVGGNMLMYLGGLQSIPTALYEASTIDGANAARRFVHITIPMLSPTIFFTTIMGIIGALQLFTESYVMTAGGPNNATLSAVLYIYRKSFQQLYFGYSSALAWVLFVIILLCTIVVFRSSAVWVYYESELRK